MNELLHSPLKIEEGDLLWLKPRIYSRFITLVAFSIIADFSNTRRHVCGQTGAMNPNVRHLSW